jgi:hypothetical protein
MRKVAEATKCRAFEELGQKALGALLNALHLKFLQCVDIIKGENYNEVGIWKKKKVFIFLLCSSGPI